jgi:hypothetical protein
MPCERWRNCRERLYQGKRRVRCRHQDLQRLDPCFTPANTLCGALLLTIPSGVVASSSGLFAQAALLDSGTGCDGRAGCGGGVGGVGVTRDRAKPATTVSCPTCETSNHAAPACHRQPIGRGRSPPKERGPRTCCKMPPRSSRKWAARVRWKLARRLQLWRRKRLPRRRVCALRLRVRKVNPPLPSR